MPRRTASWVVGLGLLGGTSMLSTGAACADNVVSAAPVSCGPQVMLYVTLPLSSGGSSSRPVFGLRIGEFRKRPTTTQLVANPPVLRELIDVQIVGHSDVRMEFGRRLVWNIMRGSFGSQSSPVVLAIGVPIKGIRLSDAVNHESWDPRTSGMSALAGNPIQALQADGERLAIVAAVISLHWTPTDRRRVHMQLRPTIRLVNTQPTEAVLLLRSAEAR